MKINYENSIFFFKSFLFIFLFILINFLHTKINESTKICICTIGKEENKYIREFVSYYEKFGVDKIFLYDNNDVDKEHFDDVIKDYIEKDFVKILNWRGVKRPHFKAINDCYIRYNKQYR